jgi:hypothetical protein
MTPLFFTGIKSASFAEQILRQQRRQRLKLGIAPPISESAIRAAIQDRPAPKTY